MLTIVVTVLSWQIVQAGLQCLKCTDAILPINCETVITCGSHENCFVDAKVTPAGEIRYDLGCRDILQCNTSHTSKRDILPVTEMKNLSVLKRTSNDSLTCSECCSNDFCNSAGCGKTGYPSPRGPLCFNCPQQSTPSDCSKITMCGQDEACMLLRTSDPVTHRFRYQTKCENEKTCNDEMSKYRPVSSTLVGKRKKKESLPISGTCVIQCCKEDLCNNICRNTSVGAFSSINTTTSSQSSVAITSPAPADPCLSNPCQSGKCSPYNDTYRCTCDYGVHGRNCDTASATLPMSTTHASPTTRESKNTSKSACVDKLDTCGLLDLSYYCYGTYVEFALENCMRSCNFCSGVDKVERAFCEYKDQFYKQNQTWSDGCIRNCTCTDAVKGMYTCQSVCLDFSALPSICHLEDTNIKPYYTSFSCCKQPRCPSGITINIPKAYRNLYPGYTYV
ncbi:neurogenic locus notch homolog protein 1-like [Mercenaria mercenaria]|uniref:neurogenic locus notch homolog protein 1-like n=1 Tax=Mercenaria mercenaria TaxID=6596 RepID=UPI00234F333F|nr:neurogenic locus notch homolog protein 1-like [Mercenaria mercenaria]